jgi:hypothetical protein
MASYNKRSSWFLLLLVWLIRVHHVLSQTTGPSSSYTVTTISELSTFITSTIILSNSTSQSTSSTSVEVSFSTTFLLTSSQPSLTPTLSQSPPSSVVASVTQSNATLTSSATSASSASPAPYTSKTAFYPITSTGRLIRRSRSYRGRKGRHWCWCWRGRYLDLNRVDKF